MLKKLRIKFIILNMVIVAMALTLAFSAICYLSFRSEQASVFSVMHETINGATMPGPGLGANDELMRPEIGGHAASGVDLIPVAVYYLAPTGDLYSIPTFASASLSSSALSQAATLVGQIDAGEGFINELGLYYVKQPSAEGFYVAFVDEASASAWKRLALLLAFVGGVALLGFLVISVFFSKWALRPVEHAWEQQQQFVADASHELKTPLTVILANTAIVRGHPEQSIASQSRWIESTQTEAKRMQELVNDMLDLARPEDSKQARQAEYAPVDFSDLVEGEVLQFESVAFENGIEFASAIEPSISLRGDERRLQRMVTTLIDNACKYTEFGGCVSVTLKQSVREITLSVRNTGTPIDPRDLPHVFDRFFRADRSRTHNASEGTRETGGYGLGLAIAQEIAHEHGGRIAATSSAAEGTTFTVTLPL